jgi:hypothetical protein
VQPQPPPGSCRYRGGGEFTEPDPKCTPGALNPAVTQGTIDQTICVRGWTRTVRPSERVTRVEKRASMAAYGNTDSLSTAEYDHLVPLSLGGAVNDPKNLWPEPTPSPNPKDELELRLNELVCDGRLPLAAAQQAIASDWAAAYRRYVR